MRTIEVNLYGHKRSVDIDEEETVQSLLQKLKSIEKDEIWEPVILLNGKRLTNEAFDVKLKDHDSLYILAKGFVMGG